MPLPAALRILLRNAQLSQCRPLTKWLENSRQLSSKPESLVYGGPKTPDPTNVTLKTLRKLYSDGVKITMVTAYDYPTAVHVDQAGIDILLVGDSAGMVVHGHDTTLPMTLDVMLSHCQAVARGASRPFLVGDLPFGTYEVSEAQAVTTAVRFLKEGGMDAVKMEGAHAIPRLPASRSR